MTAPLYHWTAPTVTNLGAILQTGVITLTESNCSLRSMHAGPPVVWLTTAADLHEREDERDTLHLPSGLGLLKRSARLMIDTRGLAVEPWADFADRYDVGDGMRELLVESGGDPENWHVCRSSIAAIRISEISIFEREEFGVHAAELDWREVRRTLRSAPLRRRLQLPEHPRPTVFR